MMQGAAILGLGRMGREYASRLLSLGIPATVWKRSETDTRDLVSAGAAVAATAQEAIEETGCAILALADGPATIALLSDSLLVDAIEKHQPLLIDTSSCLPREAIQLDELVRGLGGRYMEAPVSGGTAGAREGNLTIFAGGASSEVRQAEETVLRHLGKVHHMGAVGTGQSTKLVNQLIAGVIIGGVAEGLTLAKLAGIEPSQLLKALQGGFADSTILGLHGPRMVAQDFEPRGRSGTHAKDLRNAMAVAGAASSALPLASTTLSALESVVDRYGDLDHSALARLVEDRALELRATEARQSAHRHNGSSASRQDN